MTALGRKFARSQVPITPIIIRVVHARLPLLKALKKNEPKEKPSEGKFFKKQKGRIFLSIILRNHDLFENSFLEAEALIL